MQTLSTSPFVTTEADANFGNVAEGILLPQSNRDLHEVAELNMLAQEETKMRQEISRGGSPSKRL